MGDRYEQGEVKFYPIGGELSASFYGISLLPRQYFVEHYGASLVAFTENLPGAYQSVVALRRLPITAGATGSLLTDRVS